jgi:hypothetical protein
VDAFLFIIVLVAVIFAVDAVNRWWRQNSWRWWRRDDRE